MHMEIPWNLTLEMELLSSLCQMRLLIWSKMNSKEVWPRLESPGKKGWLMEVWPCLIIDWSTSWRLMLISCNLRRKLKLLNSWRLLWPMGRLMYSRFKQEMSSVTLISHRRLKFYVLTDQRHQSLFSLRISMIRLYWLGMLLWIMDYLSRLMRCKSRNQRLTTLKNWCTAMEHFHNMCQLEHVLFHCQCCKLPLIP